jgi:DNA-binding GntR family transcriptional regulator
LETVLKKKRPRRTLKTTGHRKRVISRQSLHGQVAERLRDMVVHGELVPGEKVPVAALSQTLGVSLTPVREALKVLAEEGLVELSLNRGARVIPYTVEEAEALFEVIAGLESLAAELAVKRMSDGDLSHLEEMHAQMTSCFKKKERDNYFELNNEIHKIIVKYSYNNILINTHEKLIVRANRGRYIALIDPERWREAMAEHESVMEAFRKRDTEVAGRIWREHLLKSGQAVQNALHRQSAGEVGPDFKSLSDTTDFS